METKTTTVISSHAIKSRTRSQIYIKLPNAKWKTALIGMQLIGMQLSLPLNCIFQVVVSLSILNFRIIGTTYTDTDCSMLYYHHHYIKIIDLYT
jgi:hypothetical protein